MKPNPQSLYDLMRITGVMWLAAACETDEDYQTKRRLMLMESGRAAYRNGQPYHQKETDEWKRGWFDEQLKTIGHYECPFCGYNQKPASKTCCPACQRELR
jgi:lipopolysaccharide biosynthesis regulator YciM